MRSTLNLALSGILFAGLLAGCSSSSDEASTAPAAASGPAAPIKSGGAAPTGMSSQSVGLPPGASGAAPFGSKGGQ